MTFYYRDLSMQLRTRHTPESRIAEILHEVKDASDVSGRPPEKQYGPAAEYAKTFPQLGGQTVAMKALMVVIGLCLLMGAYEMFRQMVLDEDPAFVGRVPVLLLLLTAQGVAVAVAFASEFRLPEGFDLKDGPA